MFSNYGKIMLPGSSKVVSTTASYWYNDFRYHKVVSLPFDSYLRNSTIKNKVLGYAGVIYEAGWLGCAVFTSNPCELASIRGYVLK